MVILRLEKSAPKTFIQFWARMYSSRYDDSYELIISKGKFTRGDLKKLWIWKNGTPLSEKKSASFEGKIANRISEINEIKNAKQKDLGSVLQKFSQVSAVWRIFLAHVISRDDFPIYDQHIHRAFLFLNEHATTDNLRRDITERLSDIQKINFYQDTYVGFFDELAKKSGQPKRQIDKALWSYGKCLKDYPEFFNQD